MTNYITIFSILTAGYLLLKTWNYSHYRIIRFDGQELFLASGAIGTAVFIVGVVLHKWLSPLLPGLHSFFEALHVKDPALHGIFIGFVIFSTFVIIYNTLIISREKTIEKLIKQHNDGLELMLLDSLKNSLFLSFTLSNGKVYIGIVNSHFFSPYQNESFQVWPFYSGHRDENKNLDLDTDYTEIYNK